MISALHHVRPGQPLRISARDFNAFVDAARYVRDRSANMFASMVDQRRSTALVRVRNASGEAQSQFAIMGVDSPVILPAEDSAAIRREVVLNVVAPVASTHAGKFVVLQQNLAVGAIGRAAIDGVTAVRLNVEDADAADYAEVTDGVTAYLTAGASGSARVLWRESGTGEKWAVVRLADPKAVSTNLVFPVLLNCTGGSQGDHENPATWVYDVSDYFTSETLAENVDPTEEPHLWRRPSVGYIIQASAGLAFRNTSNALVLTWINEVADQEGCPQW